MKRLWLRAAGIAVAVVEGDPLLDKLTTPADWDRAEALLAARFVPRTGMGFDVHAFAGDGPVMLGGIAVPHSRGLAGHSDADVVLHAITDALARRGGAWRYRRAFSAVRPAMEGRGLRSLPRPRRRTDPRAWRHHRPCRLHDHLRGAESRPASFSDAGADRAPSWGSTETDVSIKATTTEGLGFTGRREGIAAQAVASIRTASAR